MTLGEGLAGRHNALNALRLSFALLVIVAHSYAFTGHPVGATNLGSWAVAGFFAISGYLIPQARGRSTLGTFLMRRARRIYPAFWACLLVTAFVLSPTAARLAGSEYEPTAAIRYVIVDVTTKMNQHFIGPETLHTRAAWHEWNGSAWTLIFELMCYALAGVLLTSALLRRHQTATAATLLVLVTAVTLAAASPPGMMWFLVFFAAGWVVATRRDFITASWFRIGLAGGAAFAAGALVGPPLAALPLAYGVLAAGALLPGHRFTTNDISYGTYLYGWPLQQVLLVAGADRLGTLAFTALAVASALSCGALSWFLIERHCLTLRTPFQVRAQGIVASAYSGPPSEVAS